MGCKNYSLSKGVEFSHYQMGDILYMVNSKLEVQKVSLYKKDVSLARNGYPAHRNNYWVYVINPTYKGIGKSSEIVHTKQDFQILKEAGLLQSVSGDFLYPTHTDSYKSLMSCEMESQIPELLELTIIKEFKKSNSFKVRFGKKWNRFIDKLKINTNGY